MTSNQSASVQTGDHRRVGLLTGYLYLMMVMYAVSVTMIGPTMPLILSEYGIGMARGGLLTTLQSIGGILAVLGAGVAADAMRKSRIILVAYLVYGIASFAVGYVGGFVSLLFVFFAIGAGTRVTDTMLNAYTADIHHLRRGLFLNLLHTCFGIGAFLGPIYARFLFSRGVEWQAVYSYLGVGCSLVAVGLLFLSPRGVEHGPARSPGRRSGTTPFRDGPFLYLACLVMVLYVAHQSTVVVWMPMYLERVLLVDPTLAGLALSFFWLGIILGRVTCSYLTLRFPAMTILFAGSLIGGIFLAAGLLLHAPILLIVFLGITGLATGATIPLLVTIACDRFPNHTGSVSAAIFLSSSVSIMLFPFLTGFLSERIGFDRAIHITWLVFPLIVALWPVMGPQQSRQEASTTAIG
jgi:fucose permease